MATVKRKKGKRGVRAKHKPLNDHYNPFKRSRRIGPGPRGGKNRETKKWECTWTAPYKQSCVFVGEPDGVNRPGQRKKIVINKSYKKSYNREYWADHLVPNRNRKRHPIFKYNVAQKDYRYRRPDRPVRIKRKR